MALHEDEGHPLTGGDPECFLLRCSMTADAAM